jgi:ADP-ribose pyrophosphatase YjhB (NUDIX family)
MRVRCAGGIVFDPDGRLLMIRRATPPGVGLWSIPGGRCEPGEPTDVACVREVAEETGLTVAVVALVGRVERPGEAGVVFDIDDYSCALIGGELRAGDDAAQARWVGRAEFDALHLVPGLLEALTDWDSLPI